MALVPMEFDDLITDTKYASTIPTTQAGYSGDCDIDITKSGHTPVGIVGFTVGGAVVTVAQAYLLSASTARIRFVNNATYAQNTIIGIGNSIIQEELNYVATRNML